MSAATLNEDERPAQHAAQAAQRLGVPTRVLEAMVREHNIAGYQLREHQGHRRPGYYIYLDEIERLELAM